MTNQAARPTRRSRVVAIAARRLPPAPTWLLRILELLLGAILLAAAINAASGARHWPGPLDWIRQHPWSAVPLLAVAVVVVALWPHEGAVLSVEGTWIEPAGVRRALLGEVRRVWIEGVLRDSLAEVAREVLGLANPLNVELRLVERPEAVTTPWDGLRHPARHGRPLPSGTPLDQVAERRGEHLLVLGGSGAGKTSLLLEHARVLLDRAGRDADAPIPVVFHLSVWPERQRSLADWLAGELVRRYRLARRSAAALVHHDRLVLLLDGLDEVPADRRKACAAAIDAYCAEHAQVPMTVCARSDEYRKLNVALALDAAVELQPLTTNEVLDWLGRAGPRLAGLRAVLDVDPDHPLWELLTSPLLLHVAALAYTDWAAKDVAEQTTLAQLWDAYVPAMLTRPRAPDRQRYVSADTVRWLAWLATRMGADSILAPDMLPPAWLPTRPERWLAAGGAMAAIVVAVALPAAWMFGLVGLVVAMPVLGLIVAMASVWRAAVSAPPVESPVFAWRRGLVFGLPAGLVAGLAAGHAGGPGVGLALGVGVGLAGVYAGGATPGYVLGQVPEMRIQAWSEDEVWSGRATLGWLLAVLVAFWELQLIVGLVVGLLVMLILRVAGWLAGILVAALLHGLIEWNVADRLADRLPVPLVLVLWWVAEVPVGLVAGLVVGPVMSRAALFSARLMLFLQHQFVLVLLHRGGLVPTDLLDFLNYAADRGLLVRAGGGYLFAHRLLQDHLAAQTTPHRLRLLHLPPERRSGSGGL